MKAVSKLLAAHVRSCSLNQNMMGSLNQAIQHEKVVVGFLRFILFIKHLCIATRYYKNQIQISDPYILQQVPEDFRRGCKRCEKRLALSLQVGWEAFRARDKTGVAVQDVLNTVSAM